MTTKRTRKSQLKGILSLQKKRSRLLSQLATLDQQLTAKLESEVSSLTSEAAQPRGAAPQPRQVIAKTAKSAKSPKAAKAPKAAATGTRGPKGVLKAQIIEQLEKAGASGISVRDLADSLKTKAANIHTWFSTNISRTAGLSKVGPGRYALGAKGERAAKTASAKPAKAVKPAKAAKPAKATAAKSKAPKAAAPKAASKAKAAGFTPAKRGELKDNVIAELQKAGTEGITVTDLAEKVGTRYKNLYIWFVTTGKRIPGIEKVGPARYRIGA